MATTTSSRFDRFFSAFSTFLDEHYSRPQKTEREQIRISTQRVRRLDSLARLIINGDSENCAAVALLDNKWYVAANDYESVRWNVSKILRALKKLRFNANGDVVRTKVACEYLVNALLPSVTGPKKRARVMKDIKKFLTSLKTDAIFTKSEISNLLNKKCYYFNNPQKIHAEIRLISELVSKKGDSLTLTLGISKLCCKLCAAAIEAIKRTCNLNIWFRGRHGNFYFAWKPSPLVLNRCFSIFVGKKAERLYRGADKTLKKQIDEHLKDLDAHRSVIETFFIARRGAVTLDSHSAEPSSSQSESSEESLIDEDIDSDEADDSLSEAEYSSEEE